MTVIAASAGDGIVARVAGERVITVVAIEPIIAGAAESRVVARSAVEGDSDRREGDRAGVERVVPLVAVHDDSAGEPFRRGGSGGVERRVENDGVPRSAAVDGQRADFFDGGGEEINGPSASDEVVADAEYRDGVVRVDGVDRAIDELIGHVDRDRAGLSGGAAEAAVGVGRSNRQRVFGERLEVDLRGVVDSDDAAVVDLEGVVRVAGENRVRGDRGPFGISGLNLSDLRIVRRDFRDAEGRGGDSWGIVDGGDSQDERCRSGHIAAVGRGDGDGRRAELVEGRFQLDRPRTEAAAEHDVAR